MKAIPQVTLHEVATTSAGGTPSRSRKDYFGGGVPWVKSGEVDSVSITRTQESLTQAGLDASAAQLLPPGTTLVALYGATAGKVGRLGVTAATNQAVLAVRARREEDSDYLYYAVQLAAPALLRRLQGGAQPNLNSQMVRELLLPWPSKSRREHLVKLASSFDSTLAAAQALLASKSRMTHALMNELLTGKRRFPGFGSRGHGLTPPDGWRNAVLSNAMDIQFSNVDKKRQVTEAPVRLCNYMDVWRNDYIDDAMPFMAGTATATEIGRFALRKGDVLLTKDSETREDIASTACVLDVGGDLVAGYHLAVLRPLPDVAVGGFIAKQLMVPFFRRHFIRAAAGATRYGLSIESVRNATVWLPPVPEQDRIAATLQNADHDVALLKSFIIALSLQRKSAVTHLFLPHPMAAN